MQRTATLTPARGKQKAYTWKIVKTIEGGKEVLFNSVKPIGHRIKYNVSSINVRAVTGHVRRYKFHTKDLQKTHK